MKVARDLDEMKRQLSARLKNVPQRVRNGGAGHAAQFKNWAQASAAAVRSKRAPSKLLAALIADHEQLHADKDGSK